MRVSSFFGRIGKWFSTLSTHMRATFSKRRNARLLAGGGAGLIVLLLLSALIVPRLIHAQSSPLSVQYMPNNTSSPTDKIQPELQISNSGGSSVALSSLTMRYWFTRDTAQTVDVFCDYAAIGCGSVTETAAADPNPTSTADYYLQIGFSSGTLAANSNTGKIKIRASKADFSNFVQTNDYSYNGTFTSLTNWQNVTLYQNGSLVWGTEPGGSSATATPTSVGATSTPTATGSTPTATSTPTRTPSPTPTPPPHSFDLSIWQLQLPTNTSVGPPAASTSPWFLQNGDGSWTFDDPGTGSSCVPTTNSTHCRTELREDDSATNGTSGGFSPSSTNTLTATVAVNTDGWPVIGQIHADPSVSVKPVIEIYYDHNGSGNVVAGVQTTCTASGQSDTTLAADPPLGQQMTYTISYSNNQLIVTFNGKSFNLSSQSGCLASGVGGYFKAGDYGQENTHSVVTFYTVVVKHA